MVLGRGTSALRLTVESAACRGEEHAPDAGAAAGFEEAERSQDVGPGVVERVRDAVPQIDLRGVVGNEFDPLLAKNGLEVGFRDVRPDETRPLRHLLAPPGREVVHDDDAMAVVQVPPGHV